ncbi:unnamed protein product [Clavelina lepadiformis]|uniref:Mirror-image polydactyly gene 1 protein n=1 Tax=Clavelina lepadiformis TaxID=159417 RepID=A0ABP0FN89_CLALP
MDVVNLCDKQSKILYDHLKNAASDIKHLLDLQQDVSNMEQSDKENTGTDSVVESILSATSKDGITSLGHDTYHGDATKPFDCETPLVKEDNFRKSLLQDQRSSTPKSLPHAPPRKLRQCLDLTDRFNVVDKSCKDSVRLWSAESRPVALAPSQESSAGDFCHVETVLPRSCVKLSSKMLNNKLGCIDDDELSDGSQSHTVFTIAKLVSNLNAEKKKSKGLQERITILENELSAAKIELELELARREEHNAGQLSTLIEEIYKAQKERESAVLARLKLATQERDEALLRAKAFEKDARINNCHDGKDYSLIDKNLKELLHSVCEADSGRAIDKYGKSILSHVTKLKEERDRITKEEMEVVMRERDSAVHKCHVLSGQLQDYKESKKNTPEKHQLQSLRVKVLTAQQERDSALQKLSDAHDEIETLRIYYSLHKALVQNGMLAIGQAECDDASRLAEALRVAHEHNRMQEANVRRKEADIRRVTEKNERLEQLVTSLKKKVNLLTERSSRSIQEFSGSENTPRC